MMAVISGMGAQDAAILTTGCVLFLSGSACLILHDPRKPSHRRVMGWLAWAGLIFRLAHAFQLGFLLSEDALVVWEKAHKCYISHVAIIPNALLDQVAVLHSLPLWQSACIRVVYGLLSACQFSRYADPLPPGAAWWRVAWQCMLVWVLPQAFIFLPYNLLAKMCPPTPVSPVVPAGPTKKGTQVAVAQSQASAVDQFAGAGSKGQQLGADVPNTADVCSSCIAEPSTPPAHTGATGTAAVLRPAKDVPAGETPPARGATSQNGRGLAQSPNPAQSLRAQAVSSIMNSMKAAPYRSRLGAHHKACLKLHMDVSCDTLPPNLQAALQGALQQVWVVVPKVGHLVCIARSLVYPHTLTGRLQALCFSIPDAHALQGLLQGIGQGPAVHITELALRPGCVMITMSLTADHAPGTEPGSPLELGNQVAAALLPVTKQLLQLEAAQDASNHGLGYVTPSAASMLQAATKHATLQVDDQLFQVIWKPSSRSWQLESTDSSFSSPPPPSPRSLSSPTAVQDGNADLSSELLPQARMASTSTDNTPVAELPWLGLTRAMTCVPAKEEAAARPWMEHAGTDIVHHDGVLMPDAARLLGDLQHASVSGGQAAQLQLSPAGAERPLSLKHQQHAIGNESSAGRAVCDWLLYMECQVWQLPDKMAEVEGWHPPVHTRMATMDQPGLSTGRHGGGPWQLLVRSAATGAYLTTHVQRLQHVPADMNAARLATANVLVEVPDACLFHHHAAGAASSMLLYTAELWQNNTLISSSPVMSASPIGAPRCHSTVPMPGSEAGGVVWLSEWWWGTSNTAVAAAVQEVADVTEALSNDALACCQVQPPFLSFLSDMSVWLSLVREMAFVTGHCSSVPTQQSCAGHKLGAHCSSKGDVAGAALTPTAAYPTITTSASPQLPLELQQKLCEGLLQYTATIGLKGVHSMVSQQQQLLQQMQYNRGHSGISACMGALTSWLPEWVQPSRMREVVLGHTCDMCEARYKGALRVVVDNCRAFLTGAAAMLSGGAMLRSVAAKDWSYTICSLPWATCHITLAALTLHSLQCKQRKGYHANATITGNTDSSNSTTPLTGPATSLAASRHAATIHSSNNSSGVTASLTADVGTCDTGACTDLQPSTNTYMRCVVYAWWYRIVITYGLCLGAIPSVVLSPAPYFNNLLCWALILATIAITEQQQAVTVMSTARVAQVAVFLDLPGCIWRSTQEVLATYAVQGRSHMWMAAVWARVLLAPLLLVAARLLLDASLRHHILYGGGACSPGRHRAGTRARTHASTQKAPGCDAAPLLSGQHSKQE